jgi:hypothetical protein
MQRQAVKYSTNFFRDCTETLYSLLWFREVISLSQYSLVGMCSNVQNSTVLLRAGKVRRSGVNFYTISGGCSVTNMKTHDLINFEVLTAVTMKNAVFWDVAPCRSCVNRRFGGTYHLLLQGRKIRSLQPPAHAGSSLADFSTLKMEAIISSETSFHTRSTRRHIAEESILHDLICYHQQY